MSDIGVWFLRIGVIGVILGGREVVFVCNGDSGFREIVRGCVWVCGGIY